MLRSNKFNVKKSVTKRRPFQKKLLQKAAPSKKVL